MQLNAAFIKNILATYGEEGQVWLDNLNHHLEKLSAHWDFKLLHPVKDISYNFVAVVQLASKFAILKTAPTSVRLMAEAEWLNAHKKSVPVIFHTDKENNAFLMEKLEPGISLRHLVKAGDDEKATRIASQVILDLQSTVALHKVNYQHISEHVSAFSFLQDHIEKNIIDCAESIFNDLCAEHANDIVLHGDLHHDNILKNGAAWSVIDPHGYVGDPCAEVGPMIFNPVDHFPHYLSIKNIIENRLNILAEMLPFDLARIKAWSFCLAIRSIAWDVEGFGYPNAHTKEIAKILYAML